VKTLYCCTSLAAACPADIPSSVPGGMVSWKKPFGDQAYYQTFFWVLIDLIVEFLVLIIKPFDNQTES
jgi:hypothetical protein